MIRLWRPTWHREVAARGGTISAEHGIGVAKTRWLPLVRSPVELDLNCDLGLANYQHESG